MLLLWAVVALATFCGFVALGTWQVHRLAWKHDLIARVSERIHAVPVPAPAEADWPAVSAQRDEYRRVTVTGTFLNEDETFVQATTDYGGGYWVLTPLRQANGGYVLVNRGFVTPERRDPAMRGTAQPEGEMTITGLLRVTEPGGGFLRHNAPADGRWYSRDVQAIGAQLGLAPMAPYFVDEAAAPGARPPGEIAGPPSRWPVPGLTVVHFRDNHLSYAITWYLLALMVAAATGYVAYLEYRQRRGGRHATGEHSS